MSRLLEAIDEEMAGLEAQLAKLKGMRAELTGEVPKKRGGGAAGKRGRKRGRPSTRSSSRSPEGEQRHPPSGGKRRRHSRAEAEAMIRDLLQREPEISVDAARRKLKLGWAFCNRLMNKIRG